MVEMLADWMVSLMGMRLGVYLVALMVVAKVVALERLMVARWVD